MYLWYIYRIGDAGYDEYGGHVICARTENDARRLASDRAADEGSDVWLDNSVPCVKIGIADPKTPRHAIILSDFHAG